MQKARAIDFTEAFRHLTGVAPFPWQGALYERFIADPPGSIPRSCNLPTGLGKTAVIAIWLIALANYPLRVPRRLVYVVNRRTVVDQTTVEVERLRAKLLPDNDKDEDQHKEELSELRERLGGLAISTLRGQFADNREWSADPARPAVIVGTVDMIGSRLLFNGYGVGHKLKPLHAGFLGQDSLLVHDEAHLEPAFQKLIEQIEQEQRQGRQRDLRPMRVIALTATSRDEREAFELTPEEQKPPKRLSREAADPLHLVWRRQTAKKSLNLHEEPDDKKLAETIARLASERFGESGAAVLIFVRSVEDVEKVAKKLPRGAVWQRLTGTMRGLERDQMCDPRHESGCPIFARFLKAAEQDQWKVEPQEGTVYLICTSAGEVGVNLSADHLVCDLSTYESMAQRFGRVNRFGDREDTEVHVVHPRSFSDKPLDERRRLTLDLLRALNGDASPRALSELPTDSRIAAFAPEPVIQPCSDILFDSWSLTTIRGKLPGRPPVEPYLHGLRDWEPPETHVAWRDEVQLLTWDLREQYPPEELLEEYPLKPHELLRDRSDRVFAQLQAMAKRCPEAPVWLIDRNGIIDPSLTIGMLADKARKEQLEHATVLLPPAAGGLSKGMLDGASLSANDVADQWYLDKDRTKQRRRRIFCDELQPEPLDDTFRLIREIDLHQMGDDDEFDAEGEVDGETPGGGRFWRWYVRPKSADDEGSKTSRQPVSLHVHTSDVCDVAERIVERLGISDELKRAVMLAARFHDLGKRREKWQRSIGNPNPSDWLAKSGGRMKPLDLSEYRHEFGSLLDVQQEPEFNELGEDLQDLVLHLIAAHHGRGRPHFPPDEVFDPESNGRDVERFAAEVPRRFARLQRRYGRWGLAYLESLLRAADYAASANPSQEKADLQEVQ